MRGGWGVTATGFLLRILKCSKLRLCYKSVDILKIIDLRDFKGVNFMVCGFYCSKYFYKALYGCIPFIK